MRLEITIDCSCHMNEIRAINAEVDHRVVPLLEYNFKVISEEVTESFIIINIDTATTSMSFIDILNYCNHLPQYVLIDRWDLPVATHR